MAEVINAVITRIVGTATAGWCAVPHITTASVNLASALTAGHAQQTRRASEQGIQHLTLHLLRDGRHTTSPNTQTPTQAALTHCAAPLMGVPFMNAPQSRAHVNSSSRYGSYTTPASGTPLHTMPMDTVLWNPISKNNNSRMGSTRDVKPAQA